MKRRTIRNTRGVEQTRNQVRAMYNNKYYNLFMNNFKWIGLTPQQENYVMRQFWATGSVAAFKIALIDELGFAPFEVQSYNMYDFPEQVMLINKRNNPHIPSGGPKINNRDVVIGYIQENHKPISSVVKYYVDRMTEVEMVINTNLQTHKLPFVLGITPEDIEKANDIIDRILNDELVVFMDAEELNMVKSLATNTPYILDKLYQYKTSLENELLTYMGIDNNTVEKGERLLVDEVNANNALINCYNRGMLECLQDWTQDIKKYLNISIGVESTLEVARSVHETDGKKETTTATAEEKEDKEVTE